MKSTKRKVRGLKNFSLTLLFLILFYPFAYSLNINNGEYTNGFLPVQINLEMTPNACSTNLEPGVDGAFLPRLYDEFILSYISQLPFNFLEPESKKVITRGVFDFCSYLVDRELIPRFLSGFHIEEGEQSRPDSDDNINEQYQNYLQDLRNSGVPFADSSEIVRTFSSEGQKVVQYIQQGGNGVVFLYKFLNSNSEVSDYIYGSYTCDESENLKNIEVYKYIPDKGVGRYALNIEKNKEGYKLIYEMGTGNNTIRKTIKIENYEEGDFDNNGLDDVKFDILGMDEHEKVNEAYHIELDDFSFAEGEFLGVLQKKVLGITDLSQVGVTYTRYIPEDDATVILEYSGLAKPKDSENKFNKPRVTYIKNISPQNLLQISFKSPTQILREDMNGQLGKEILQIFNARKDDINDYSIKLATEDEVYSFSSVKDREGKTKKILNYYHSPEENEQTKLYEEKACTYYLDSNFDISLDLDSNFNILEKKAKQFMKNSNPVAETTYTIEKDKENNLIVTRESYASKEGGIKEIRISKVKIDGTLQEIISSSKELEEIFSRKDLYSQLKMKADCLLRIDKDNKVNFISGYAMENEDGVWMPIENEAKDLILSSANKLGAEIDRNILEKVDNETIGITWDGSKLTQIKIFSSWIQKKFFQYGEPWLFKIYEYSTPSSGEFERVGVGEISSNGSSFQPLFYLKQKEEGRFEVEYDLGTETPLLSQLLKYTNQTKKFEKNGVVRITLMQDAYNIWNELKLGKAGDSSMLTQIENLWLNYIEVLKDEGKRIGFEVEIVKTEEREKREVPVVVEIRKVDVPVKEILEISVDEKIAKDEEYIKDRGSANDKLLDRIVINRKYGDSVIEKTIAFSYPGEVSLVDWALLYWTQYKIFKGAYNLMVNWSSFAFDNLGRFRIYDEPQIRSALIRKFLPYVDPETVRASDKDTSLINMLLSAKYVDLDEVKKEINEMDGIWLEREKIDDRFNVREHRGINQDISSLKEALDELINYCQSNYLLPLVNEVPGSGYKIKWGDFIKTLADKKVVEVYGVDGKITEVNNLEPGNYTLVTSNKIAIELNMTDKGVDKVSISDPTAGEIITFTPEGVTHISMGELGRIIQIWKKTTQNEETQDEEDFGSLEDFLIFIYQFVNNDSNFNLDLNVNGEKLEERGVDIYDLIAHMELTGIDLPKFSQRKQILQHYGFNFISQYDTFMKLANLVKTCTVVDNLADGGDLQQLKANLWNEVAAVALDIFGGIGKWILDRAGIVTGESGSDKGVVCEIPLDTVYLNQGNVNLYLNGAAYIGFSNPLKTKIKFDEDSFKKWVKTLLGDKVTESELDYLWEAYDYFKPAKFYKFLREDPNYVEEFKAYYRQENIKINPQLYKQLTFPQPGDDWPAMSGQMVLVEQALKIKWSHIISAALITASYIATPYLAPAVQASVSGLLQALKVPAVVAGKIGNIASELVVAGLNAVKISAQFVPFTAAMMLRQGATPLDWFNQLGDQILTNAIYSFLFGMVFNPSLLGSEYGVLPAIGKLGKGLGKLGEKLDGPSLLRHIGAGTLKGLGKAWYWTFNYGDELTKLIIGTEMKNGVEVARTTLRNPRYVFYLYLAESTLEEGLIPSIVNWQLRTSTKPGVSDISGSRKILASLARSQMLCTENAGNIAEMTDPLESPFFAFLFKPFVNQMLEKYNQGELDDYMINLVTFLYEN